MLTVFIFDFVKTKAFHQVFPGKLSVLSTNVSSRQYVSLSFQVSFQAWKKKKKDILVREAFIRWCRGLENVLIKIKFALKFCHLKWSSYLPRPANNFTFFSWYFVTFFSLKNQGAVPLISTYFQTCFWDVGDSVTWCALDLLCKIRYIGKTVLFIQNCLAVGFWLVSHLC